MSASGGAKWFKVGCLGCVGVVAVVALLLFGTLGFVWVSTPDPVVEDRVLRHEVQAPAPNEPRHADGESEVAFDRLPSTPGRVEIDVESLEFEVVAGRPGDPLKVEARYDTASYEMVETFEEAVGEEPWSYSLRFRHKGSGLVRTLRQIFGGTSPELQITLPPDVPFGLDLSIAQGGARVDLGGLWLTEADVRSSMAGLMLLVSEPTRVPVERMDIDASMAGVQLERLGNASPRTLDVDVSMAGVQLDLRGAWRNDSDIALALSSGGGFLRLPEDVRLEGLPEGKIRSNPEPEIEPPTLRFKADKTTLEDFEISQ